MSFSFSQNTAVEILHAAMMRSFGAPLRLSLMGNCTIAHCSQDSSWQRGAPPRGKLLVFGPPEADMTSALGIAQSTPYSAWAELDICAPANGDIPYNQSPGYLRYGEHSLLGGLSCAMRKRPFTRFDYADEWNNLGFGRIRTDGSIWAAHGGFTAEKATELAGAYNQHMGEEAHCGAYMTLFDTPKASVLWCSRPVGPVDSTEWSVIERFVSDWRSDHLPCLPCLCQTPYGYQCIVTMRLDCDEDVGSARDIFTWYEGQGIPFSLAVKTSLALGPADLALLEDVRRAEGTLLSHTHTHQYNWGSSIEGVTHEATASRRWFAETWPDTPPPDLAVSPFHTNPSYAVQGMIQAGFAGFVSGIIHNDPEYLLGRAGIVPFADGKIVSISQQSMLHGDCYSRQGKSVRAHVDAFAAQYAARGIFGYLDHPFSTRYQYDWESKEQRLQAHQQLISAIRKHKNILFWPQQECFDFVKALGAVRLLVSSTGAVSVVSTTKRNDIVYRYKGCEYRINDGISL
ncbi:MAG: hypothetical protein QM579_13430 [Desulfovibrio sp.]|uniref:hypothetical protein n=1 Tax=Desulfovibrio sp. TaxID=885 RepID=UPI0039E330DB